MIIQRGKVPMCIVPLKDQAAIDEVVSGGQYKKKPTHKTEYKVLANTDEVSEVF